MPVDDLIRKTVEALADRPGWMRGWRMVVTAIVIALAGLYLAFCGATHLGGG
jgi:hypothetical protein